MDEVSGRIIFALSREKGEIKRAQFREAWGKDATSLEKYDYFLRGLDIYMNGDGPADIARAHAIWQEGPAKYSNPALLKTKMAWGHWTAAWRYWEDLGRNSAEEAPLVTKALTQDNLSPEMQRSAHWLNAFVQMQRGNYADGVEEAKRTIALTPYDVRARRPLTDVLIADGKYEMALDWLARAEPRELGREDERTLQRALIYRLTGTYDEALAEYAKAPEPDIYPRLSRAVVLVQLGRIEARARRSSARSRKSRTSSGPRGAKAPSAAVRPYSTARFRRWPRRGCLKHSGRNWGRDSSEASPPPPTRLRSDQRNGDLHRDALR